MNKLKIFAIALMTFAAGIPASADNDNNGKEEQYEEIDNFDSTTTRRMTKTTNSHR